MPSFVIYESDGHKKFPYGKNVMQLLARLLSLLRKSSETEYRSGRVVTACLQNVIFKIQVGVVDEEFLRNFHYICLLKIEL